MSRGAVRKVLGCIRTFKALDHTAIILFLISGWMDSGDVPEMGRIQLNRGDHGTLLIPKDCDNRHSNLAAVCGCQFLL